VSEKATLIANFIKNTHHVHSMKWFIVLVVASFLIAGCSTKYVCYDGTTQKEQRKCPTVAIPVITLADATRSMENYGNAVAQAKREAYTKVNIYAQNGSWYSTGLFTNSETNSIKQVQFKIDGKTSEVTCITGCDYIGKTK
jgi:hypothetical protein